MGIKDMQKTLRTTGRPKKIPSNQIGSDPSENYKEVKSKNSPEVKTPLSKNKISSSNSSLNLKSYNNPTSNSSQKGNYSSSDEGEFIKRKTRPSILLGKISSFMHKDDILHLMDFVDKRLKTLDNDFIKCVEGELKRLEKRLKRLFALEAVMFKDTSSGAPKLKDVFKALKEESEDLNYFGGPKDSDGLNTPERLKKFLQEETHEDTVLTSRAIQVYKVNYKRGLSRVNSIQYTTLGFMKRYFLLKVFKETLEGGSDGRENLYSKAKDALEDIKANLKAFTNVRND